MDDDIFSVATLSALRVSGQDWENVLWHGGPKCVVQGAPELVASLLNEKKRLRLPFDSSAVAMKRAQEQARGLNFFVRSGGLVLGTKGPHELGRLLRAPSAPLCAFLRGNRELLRKRPVVAIIGTRSPSTKGAERAFDLAAQLSKAGCLVISGGAKGVDIAAHKGALSAGGETLAVLGETLQLDRDERPSRILSLQPSAALSTLTTFGPWVSTTRSLFVVRNQYVAALSDAVVIIEGKLDSGTLHTARFARQMDIPVWVIPGDIENPLAGAANLLLQENNARALVNVEVLLKTLGISISSHRPADSPLPREKNMQLELEQQPPLIQCLAAYGGRGTLDLLCDALREPVSKLQKDLLEFELMGTIQRQGSEFVLV